MKLTIEVAGKDKKALRDALEFAFAKSIQSILVDSKWKVDYSFGTGIRHEYRIVLDEDAGDELGD